MMTDLSDGEKSLMKCKPTTVWTQYQIVTERKTDRILIIGVGVR